MSRVNRFLLHTIAVLVFSGSYSGLANSAIAALQFEGSITTPDFTSTVFQSRIMGTYLNAAPFQFSFEFDPDAEVVFFDQPEANFSRYFISSIPQTLEFSSASGYHYSDSSFSGPFNPVVDQANIYNDRMADGSVPAGDAWIGTRVYYAHDAPVPGDRFYASQIVLIFENAFIDNSDYFLPGDLSQLIHAEINLVELLIGSDGNATASNIVVGVANLDSVKVVPLPTAAGLFFVAFASFPLLRSRQKLS